MSNPIEVYELTANEWSFLTLCAGLTLDPGDKVILKKDLAQRTIVELGEKVTLSDTFDFNFVDGDVTVDPTNEIAEAAHGMSNGDRVLLSTDGVLPTGLDATTRYYVVGATAGTFQLSLTEGGAAVQITAAAGGGTHRVAKLRDSLEYSTFEIVRA